MGIKSTRDISRTAAIKRIHEIATIISSKHYKKLESAGFEDCPPLSVIDNPDEQVLANRLLEADLDSWTNKMIEDALDRPFYRFSMFDNYLITDDI
jgi:hypothetical protein